MRHSDRVIVTTTARPQYSDRRHVRSPHQKVDEGMTARSPSVVFLSAGLGLLSLPKALVLLEDFGKLAVSERRSSLRRPQSYRNCFMRLLPLPALGDRSYSISQEKNNKEDANRSINNAFSPEEIRTRQRQSGKQVRI